MGNNGKEVCALRYHSRMNRFDFFNRGNHDPVKNKHSSSAPVLKTPMPVGYVDVSKENQRNAKGQEAEV